MKEKDAIARYSEANVLIGVCRYQDTAKGEAMELKDYFVKIIVESTTMKMLGAHIIGPYASVLIQEIVNVMNTPDQNAQPVRGSMHIHPALSEVVAKASNQLMSPKMYHHTLQEHFGLPSA